MTMKTALLIGATGLTGSHVLNLLFADDRFSKVKVFARRSTNISHPKLEEHIVNFDHTEEWKHLIIGDVLFSALGTTLKKAGGKVPQYNVDYTYQYNVAKAAAENGVPVYVLVSSVGANADSMVFYSKMKGELEQAIKKLPFRNIHIMQPGPLEGDRAEERPSEKAGLRVIKFITNLGLFKGYKPIHGEIVARAMVNASFDSRSPIKVYRLLEIFERAET
ncbi:MAG: NAD(P)H-binding protein [Bacteroidetes bacterium]|nr:NAD(P)H-binding protein [Bacteroidota bacterium]